MRRELALGLALAVAAGCSGPASQGTKDGVAGSQGADADAGAPDGGREERGETTTAPDADAGGMGDADRPPPSDGDVDMNLPGLCGAAMPTITPQSTGVVGILTGPSRNPAVSCNGTVATTGPEAFFKLEVSTYSIVALTVAAPINAFVAIRTGCGEDASEIICSNMPPPIAFPDPSEDGGSSDGPATDGGKDSPIADARPPGIGPNPFISTVRAGLPAGSYLIVVDTQSLGGLTSAPFTLDARVFPIAANGTCEAATLLTAEAPSARGDVNFGGQPQTSCGGSTGGALYYSVGVPAHNRLTVRAQPSLNGFFSWMPTLTAFPSCGGTTCLAQASSAAGNQELDWVNNGTSWRLVTFSVGANDAPVTYGAFDVTASVTDVLASCARPTTVQDGTVLSGQDFATAQPNTNLTCSGPNAPALYYVATLLPQQVLVPTLTFAGAKTSVKVAFRTSCDDDCPNSQSQQDTFVNLTAAPQTVLMEVSSQSGPAGRFDLQVFIPPPPASIQVTPTTGLVTTEGGGTATFQVVLTSPPTAPVSVAVASDTPGEGTASPEMVSFDANDWNQPHVVTVTGVDDHVSDGPRKYKIVTAPATSADPRYTGFDADDVAVTNLDDEPGLVIEGADELVTSEDGAAATFTIRLDTKPTATVTVPLTSTNTAEGAVSPASLTFSTSDWNVPHVVTVTGGDDTAADGTQPFSIEVGPVVSTDASYGGRTAAPLLAHNKDNDQPAVMLKVISGATSCTLPSQAPIAVDDFGAIYVVAACDGHLAFVTSADGGVTFSALAPIPNTLDAGEFAVAAGAPGTAHVAFVLENGGLLLTDTTDSGETWSTPRNLIDSTATPRIVAARGTVVVVADDPVRSGGSSIVRSVDAGQTFFRPQPVDFQTSALALQPDGQSVFFVGADSTLRASGDAGATLKTVGTVSVGDPCCTVVGRQFLYSLVAGSVTTNGLTDTTSAGTFSGPAGSPLAATIDDAGTLTIIDNDGNQTVASRFHADMTLSPPQVLGPNADTIRALALSRRAVAVVFSTANLILFSLTTWP